jgi:hypothetical protein
MISDIKEERYLITDFLRNATPDEKDHSFSLSLLCDFGNIEDKPNHLNNC